MKKFLGILVLSLLISTYCYADSKFDKDLKKLSKLKGANSFVDNEGETYPIKQISNKENNLLIIYNHGSFAE